MRTDASAYQREGRIGKRDGRLRMADLEAHLEGSVTRGLYLVKPGESVCKVAILDLDSHKGEIAWEDMLAAAWRISERLKGIGLVCAPWRSSGGSGIHLILSWEEAQDAYSVRAVIMDALRLEGFRAGPGGVARGEVEVFPKQDMVRAGGYGNYVWLPLAGESVPLVDSLIGDGWRAGTRDHAIEYNWPLSEPVTVKEKPLRLLRTQAVSLSSPTKSHALQVQDNLQRIEKLLEFVKPDEDTGDYDYDLWMRVAFAIHHATGGSDEGFSVWAAWSARGASCPAWEELESKWASIKNDGSDGGKVVTIKSLEHEARGRGWIQDVTEVFENLEIAEGDEGVDIRLPPFTRVSGGGPIKATTNNLIMAMGRGDICGAAVRYDTFLDEVLIVEAGRGGPEGQWRRIKDSDYTWIKSRLEKGISTFQPIARTELREVVWSVAEKAAFDSAKEWLEGLKWDGIERVASFVEKYFGGAGGPYGEAVSRYIWTGLAGRVMRPGCQADMVPVLVGGQGEGKSRGVKAIAPQEDFFCEIAFHEKDDDLARKMRGVMVVEIAELQGLGTREEESIKAFLTRDHEKWIPKYKEHKTIFPRRAIFFGTTNADEFLADVTGNRRWLPFRVGNVDVEAIKRDREQLWAEGVSMWREGGIAYQGAEELARGEHEQYRMVHPWEDRIQGWLDAQTKLGVVVDGEGVFVSSSDIFNYALGMAGRTSSGDGRSLAKVMKKLGYAYTRGYLGPVQFRGWKKAA